METPHNPNAKPGERGYLSQGQLGRKYGKREGLAKRLEEHADRLAYDKTSPWLGMGLYDDLRAAAAVLAGRPIVEPKTQEYDL